MANDTKSQPQSPRTDNLHPDGPPLGSPPRDRGTVRPIPKPGNPTRPSPSNPRNPPMEPRKD